LKILPESDGFGRGAIALAPARTAGLFDRGALRRGIERAAEADLVVDLGQRIGSREWWRGLATCTALCGLAISFAPGFAPLQAPVAPALGERQQQEMKAEAIAPSAYGADTGQRMAPTNLVEKLTDTPERPQIQVTAALGTGDGFARVLQRAGVGADEAKAIAAKIAGTTDLSEIKAGTKLDLTCSYPKGDGDYTGPIPSAYALVVHTREGGWEQVATWKGLPGKTMRLTGATATGRTDITSVEVRTSDGWVVLKLPV